MRVGLAAFPCRNGDTAFNMESVGRAMRAARGRADVVCFGEAFLQGFDSLSWDHAADLGIAVSRRSKEFAALRRMTKEYVTAIVIGYIERDGEDIFSSCAVISRGRVVSNYRRISKGWKEYSITGEHYREGDAARPFRLGGVDMTVALCGDMWDAPEAFRTDGLLIWPVYVCFTPEEWNSSELGEYAKQAALAADTALMINPIDADNGCRGGAFVLRRGRVAAAIPFDEEQILIYDTDERRTG